MRPTLRVGTPVLYVSTSDICRMTLSLSRMLSAEKSANDSAQSPACRRKPLPSATRASVERSVRASPANTSGGIARNSASAPSSSAATGHAGCCAAGGRCQLVGSHSRLGSGCGAVIVGSKVGAGRRVARLERPPLAHLFELLLGLHLLGEERRLDPVEEA